MSGKDFNDPKAEFAARFELSFTEGTDLAHLQVVTDAFTEAFGPHDPKASNEPEKPSFRAGPHAVGNQGWRVWRLARLPDTVVDGPRRVAFEYETLAEIASRGGKHTVSLHWAANVPFVLVQLVTEFPQGVEKRWVVEQALAAYWDNFLDQLPSRHSPQNVLPRLAPNWFLYAKVSERRLGRMGGMLEAFARSRRPADNEAFRKQLGEIQGTVGSPGTELEFAL